MADNNTEKQRVQELTDKLEQGLQDLFNSDSYRNYLSTMSKFHNYSFNNTLLIAMQKSDATLVAGYKAWQKNFERHVNKGEKAIRILAPAPYKIKEERDKIDPLTQELLLDKDGNPQKEEVEITIPAFRAVSVFDLSQTDGKPIPELTAKELLSDVEGYQDMIRAVEAISPVPIELEEIAGDSKGYYDREAKRIAVQENMSESQTLKTMIHEVAHSKLHSKEVEQDEQMRKDRNTKEVEAESVAYTVCQHFGIDTSDYSFGYIAGWSSGRDTKELRSSMDTIRKTASELITGIEEQLQELQRDREVSQEQTKESILLIQNTDLSEFSLLDVYGMGRVELMQALSEMTDDDKLSIQAYLESRGAWTTEIGNQDSREYGEYHLDVRYNTDTGELIDMKERKAIYDKAMEPINADDVVIKFASAFESEWEVLKITNMSREDVGKILKDMASLYENEWDGNYLSYMEKQGAKITLLASSSKGLNGNMPDFWDYEYDFDAGLTDVEELSVMQHAEHIINRLEHGQPAFSEAERNLIVNYAYKLGNIEKTRELAEHIYAQEVDGNQDVALAMIDAEAEIDALPDSMVGVSEMQEYGYTWNEMFPLTQERAIELFDHDLPVYLLHTDGSETTVSDRKQITEHDGMCGIEKGDWLNERKLQMMQEELSESDSNREAQLLYGNTDKYGIYQLKDDPELDKFRFEGTESLKRMGITKDNFDAVLPENYKLVYMGELTELQGQTQSETLEAIYTKFNIDHPADYKAHSLSVSDIVVLHEDGENSAHFVDSFGFTELPKFMLTLEGKENEIQTELAVHIADRYILMHECDEGYDYSILNEQYHLLDGGVYDNPDITIQRAMDMVIADLKEPRFSAVTEQYYRDEFLQGEVYAGSEAEIVDFEELSEKAEEVEQADLEAKQAEFRENNPDVVADFRAKTEELFHSLDGQSADDIEKMVYAYVQSQIDEYGLDAEIVDVVVAGSRCRGIEKENSDLDVVVEYIGSTREDDLFNLLHEDSIYIAGIQVDINPITEGKTGTLETYLPEVETYLQEKAQQEQINNQLVTQGREVVQEQNALASEEKVLSELEKEPMVEPETVHITFTVAECGEFHNMGEYHEGIETIEEAMKLYNAIDPSRMHGIPSIGVNMHIEGTEEWEDEEADIVRGNCIDVDFLNYTPELRDTPTVQDALKKLIAAYPEKEVNDRETKETKIQTLAAELDQLSYDIDTFEYRDLVPDREAQVQMIANDIRSGNVKPLQIFLQTSIDGGIDEDSERQAKELIAKLAEYKPLAKIEELEEQNYNMIDDRLNNGVEKFNREEEKKEQQEKPQARSSLKERLVAKQKEVAQGKNKDAKEQDKTKKTNREEI
ncbi:ssDNA-binding domain-containing protein [Lachnospiraceae bacterium CLA-AA-H215]|jgi:antirestriction protein ArdC/predicted nucleotidyltransferase|uniref:SsDNA-binding domain-containing protein n=3 Tax=Hominifimenecus microfluidus TaxID=2885348 RepID=A0AAE3ECM1_9FIRM|nr:YodL domain-containing protein [Hominifimenecus microfluidus]MCC2232273.1 ssDNA-binding domain-containing protein [Hominifimenecus microfluidus]